MTVFLRMLYLRTEQDLLKELNRLRENGFVEYGTYASLMRVQAILQEMQDESFQYVPQAISKVFNETNKRLGYKAAEALSVPQTAIAEQLAANLLGNINEAAETAFRTSERIMQIGRLHPDAFRNPTIEASLFREAGGVGETAVEKALKTFNTQNVTSFVDKSGREWGLTEYCTMATRTVSKQAVVAAELTADDWDLWKISPNGTTCALCAAYEGRVYSKSGTNPDYPPLSAAFGKIDAAAGDDLSNTYLNIHPNCLVPGGSVLGEGIVAESRRLYSGEIIILKTSRGNEIAVTPNHPVLTDRGFIAAYLLKEGDKVIEATGEYGRLIGKAPNNIDVPTVVDEKLHSLMQSCGGSAHTVKGTAEQFHGDGIPDSKVDIVFTNGFRRSELNTPGNKEIPEKEFPSGILRRYKFLSDCPAAKVFLGAFHTLNGIVSGGGFVRCIKGITEHGEHLSDLSTGTPALGGNLVISKPLVMQGKKALEHLTMFINEFFRNIRELLTPGSLWKGNAEIGFGNLNHIRADRKFPRNISTGEPLLIARIEELLRNDGLVIGELTHVESSFYDGYVYNFETEYGYYVYNNIVTHNCLHSLVKYTTAGRTEKEIQRDKDFSSFEKRPANVDYRTKRQIKEYREKEKTRAEFLETRRQWNEYRERLGDKIPSLETFEKHKKANDDKYKEWMSAYRKKGAEIRKSLPKPEPIPVEPKKTTAEWRQEYERAKADRSRITVQLAEKEQIIRSAENQNRDLQRRIDDYPDSRYAQQYRQRIALNERTIQDVQAQADVLRMEQTRVTAAQFKAEDELVKGFLSEAKKIEKPGLTEAIKNANPNFDRSRTAGFKPYNQNCQRCIYVYEARRRGYDVEALPSFVGDKWPKGYNFFQFLQGGEGIKPVATASTSKKFKANIEEQMRQYGDGSRAVVRVGWKGRNFGHVFIAEQENGRTRFIDPQSGSEDVTWYFGNISPSKSYMFRVDDKKFSPNIEEAFKVVKP